MRFDENAALLQAPDELWEALIERDWRRLCVGLRPLWARERLVLFGHALPGDHRPRLSGAGAAGAGRRSRGVGRLARRPAQRRRTGRQTVHAAAGAGRSRLVAGQ